MAFGLGPRDEVLRIITNAGIWFHDPKTFELLYLLGVPVDFYRFSDDGRLLATAMDDTSIAVWDVVNGTEIARLRGFRNGLTAIAFDGAAARLAVGTGDGEMLVWDIESRKCSPECGQKWSETSSSIILRTGSYRPMGIAPYASGISIRAGKSLFWQAIQTRSVVSACTGMDAC